MTTFARLDRVAQDVLRLTAAGEVPDGIRLRLRLLQREGSAAATRIKRAYGARTLAQAVAYATLDGDIEEGHLPPRGENSFYEMEDLPDAPG